jgi:hypothetical protein
MTATITEHAQAIQGCTKDSGIAAMLDQERGATLSLKASRRPLVILHTALRFEGLAGIACESCPALFL